MKLKPKTIQQIPEFIPRHSYSLHSKQMEPVNLFLLGDKRQILKKFRLAGWYLSDPISFFPAWKSFIATIFNKSYRNGPMWPSYLAGRRNQLGFERPTESDTFRRRHHIRLWKTAVKIGKKRLWAGTVSYDRGVGHFNHSLIPLHHISSTLDNEGNFLARTFKVGKPVYIQMGHPEEGHINTGDPYTWDGQALVIDLNHAA